MDECHCVEWPRDEQDKGMPTIPKPWYSISRGVILNHFDPKRRIQPNLRRQRSLKHIPSFHTLLQPHLFGSSTIQDSQSSNIYSEARKGEKFNLQQRFVRLRFHSNCRLYSLPRLERVWAWLRLWSKALSKRWDEEWASCFRSSEVNASEASWEMK